MGKQSSTYVIAEVLVMNGNLRKELPTVERVVDENGRLTVTESDLAGRATLTRAINGVPYVILAEENEKDALNYLTDLCRGGLRICNSIGLANSLDGRGTTYGLKQRLGYF